MKTSVQYNVLPVAICRFIMFCLLSCILPNVPVKAQSATIDKVWFDFDVTLNGETGMKIHADYHVNGAKGRTLDLSVNHYFIYQSDGGPVFGDTPGYWAPGPNGKGQAVGWTRSNVNILHDPEYLYDSWVFVPYRVIGTGSGTHNIGVVTFVRDCGREEFIQEKTVKTWFQLSKSAETPARQQNSDVKTPRTLACPGCSGSLHCNYCSGLGYTWAGSTKLRCGACNGTGICQDCHGTGIWKVIYD